MTGYRHCITEESVDRQRQFELALLDLMTQKNFCQISIQELCHKVSLSRKTFYRYFSSREACLNALIDHAILDITDLPMTGSQMQQMLTHYFSYWKAHTQLLDALCRSGLTNLLFERGMLCASQEFGIHAYLNDRSGSYAQTIFFISGLTGVLIDWHLGGYQSSPEELASMLTELLPSYPHGVF